MTERPRETALEQVLSLKNCVVGISTGTPYGQVDYVGLRQPLSERPDVWDRMPLAIRTCRVANEIWGYIKDKGNYADRREHWRSEFEPVLSYLESGTSSSPSIEDSSLRLNAFDGPHVSAYWKKSLERLDRDPEGAVTAARSLIESTCKHILEAAGEPYEDKGDLRSLYRQVARQLSLAPDSAAEQSVKQILQGCQSVVEGIASVRSSLGDAHGKGGNSKGARMIDAKLAVNLAGAMCTFLLECAGE